MTKAEKEAILKCLKELVVNECPFCNSWDDVPCQDDCDYPVAYNAA